MLYFVVVIGFSMFFMHPASLVISLVCAFSYSVYLSGGKAARAGLKFLLPVVLSTAAVNSFFNHQGGTMLAFLPNGNPITFEAVAYGFAAGVMLTTVIAWFSCLNAVMTSDKFVYLFGRAIPALSLVLSMALRFVPRFRGQAKVISNAQKRIGRDMSSGNILRKARNGMRILSILVTWALENAIETADSMKSRGYGLPGRTAFSIYRFDRRDGLAVSYIFACAGIVVAGAALEVFRFRYFPTIGHISRGWHEFWTIALLAAHLALGAFPIIVNIKEDLVWKRINSLKLQDGA